MDWFTRCFTGKRKKSIGYHQGQNEQLPRPKSLIKQNGRVQQYDESKMKGLSKINLPKSSIKHSVIRNQTYSSSQITDLKTGLKICVTDQELNFQLDYDDGISHNLTINTFHYETQNEKPGFMYYRNIGPNGLAQKQNQSSQKQQNRKQQFSKQLDFTFGGQTDQLPTRQY